MLHPIAIVASLRLLNVADLPPGPMLYVCSFILTIILAVVSYHFLETPFLRLKLRFAPPETPSNTSAPPGAGGSA